MKRDKETTTRDQAVTDKDWRNKLSEEEYRVLREKGTELPFSGLYNTHFEDGVYKCKGCGNVLFKSENKFHSNCGWPSFDAGISEGAIEEREDLSHGMVRTEIVCSNCGGHLGHVFDDGPTETGLRYCVNSVALDFERKGGN